MRRMRLEMRPYASRRAWCMISARPVRLIFLVFWVAIERILSAAHWRFERWWR